jgi:hypothetical protein
MDIRLILALIFWTIPVYIFFVIVLLLKFVVLQLLRWVSRTPRVRVRGDSDQIEREIERLIPIGTPVAQAKKIMDRNGFKCEYVVHGTFTRSRGDGSPDIVLRNADLLSCHRARLGCFFPIWPSRNLFFFPAQDWICAFEHKEGSVTRVFAKTWLTGP